MTAQEARLQCQKALQSIYDTGEAAAISRQLLEWLAEKNLPAGRSYPHWNLPETVQEKLEEISARLLKHEPLQYVLGEAWFFGQRFLVNKNVLIPRPETEELVEWILSDDLIRKQDCKVLDIGTGSGCIPITLKRKAASADVWACDVSEAALDLARKNAERLQAGVQFLLLDILDEQQWTSLPSFDLIVSNPPYIPAGEALQMDRHVREFEPHLALFVPDGDPLLFYRTICSLAKKKLRPGGAVYLEVHIDHAGAVSALFENAGYTCHTRKDMQGAERMVRAESRR